MSEQRQRQVTERHLKYREQVLRGCFEGILGLDEKARDMALRETSRRCLANVVERAGFDPRKINDIDEFIEAWSKAFPGRRNIQRVGDLLQWQFNPPTTGAPCPCPFVRDGVIEPSPKLCLCSANWVRHLVEMVTKKPVQVDLIESPLTTGADACRFVVHLKPPLFSSTGSP